MALLYPILAFVLTLVLIPAARDLALAWDFVDRPGGRKRHEDDVPPIGGLVIVPIYVALTLISGIDVETYLPYLLALGLLVVTGVMDDLLPVPAWLRFLVHLLAASLVVIPDTLAELLPGMPDTIAAGAQIDSLGDLFGTGELMLGDYAPLFTIICIALLINAVNMMDGLDGLAGGVALIALFWLILAAAYGEFWGPLHSMSILAGTLAGFLVYNLRSPFRKKASVFLGDSGSMALGLMLAWYAIGLSQGDDPVIVPASVAWVLALPVFDAFGLILSRVMRGRHPFDPDRNHFHHHFIRAGFTPGRATAHILIIATAFGAIGYGGISMGMTEYALIYTWVALIAIHTAITFNPRPFIYMLARKRGRGARAALARDREPD